MAKATRQTPVTLDFDCETTEDDWSVEMILTCRYCDKPVETDSVVTHSYWQGVKFVSHAACKVVGEKSEALECQTIDADCNDCRHFQRGQLVGKEVWSGHCQKFNHKTRAYPKKWTGRECFEHRRLMI